MSNEHNPKLTPDGKWYEEQYSDSPSQREDLLLKLKEQLEMIGGLASEYHALYYFNISQGSFKVYSIDERRFPEAKAFVGGGGDPIETFKHFGASELVHPEDRHVFQDLSVATVLAKLANTKKLTYRFRRKFGDEYLWTDMEFIKFEDTNERPNAIALGFAERDSEIRTQQALNRCFAILSQDISPEESIDELMALAGEFYGAKRAYIFEFNTGRDLMDNTFEWCQDGVDPMISQLQGIPAKEVDGWIHEFKRHGAFYMDTLDKDNAYSTPEGRAILEMQGIQSLIAAPIMSADAIVGFIGVDDPTKAQHNIDILKNISVVAYSEILKRKQKQMAMYESAKVFSDAFLKSYISAYYVNLVDCSQVVLHRSQFINESFGHIDNYLESISKYIDNYVHPEDQGIMNESVQPEYIRKRLQNESRFSVYMRDISGLETRWYRFDVTRGSDEDHAGLAFSDVTEKLEEEKRKSQLLQDAYEAADVANKSKTSFLFNMSHDIRTPMNAITGFTSMAKKHLDDRERITDYLDKIELSSQQLLMLINQVLEMSRIESGKIEFNEVPVNVKESYDSLVAVLSEQAKVNGLEFHHHMSDIKHYHIFADDARMSQITLNITGNAIKYTPQGGRIEYTFRENPCERDGYASYTFTVEDTGIGMSEDFQRVIFEPFSREQNSTVSKIQGTGLGLSIVKSLVDMMGGTIEVHSQPGQGTSFAVTIEHRLAEDEKPAEAAAPSDLVKDFAGRRVLLVEDNELNREIASFILKEKGLAVEEAEDGDVAVDMVQAAVNRGDCYHYDLILMDIQMPRMDGYKATARLREIYARTGVHIPIVAMTANAFEEDRQNARIAGMDDHIAKPIDVDQLWATLSKYVK